MACPGAGSAANSGKVPSSRGAPPPVSHCGALGGSGWGSRGSLRPLAIRGCMGFRRSSGSFAGRRRGALPDRPLYLRPAERIGPPPSILTVVDGDAVGRGREGLSSSHGICGGFCKPAFDSGLEFAAAPPSGRKKWLWLRPEACSLPKGAGSRRAYEAAGRARYNRRAETQVAPDAQRGSGI